MPFEVYAHQFLPVEDLRNNHGYLSLAFLLYFGQIFFGIVDSSLISPKLLCQVLEEGGILAMPASSTRFDPGSCP